MKTCVILDLDGTISNCGHRLHHITKTKKKNWKKFFESSLEDELYQEIYDLVRALWLVGFKIVVSTARPENYRPQTEQWLDKVELSHMIEKVYMRPKNDFREDAIIKTTIMLEQIRTDGYKPYFVLEDKDNVTKAYRELGIKVLQVAPSS